MNIKYVAQTPLAIVLVLFLALMFATAHPLQAQSPSPQETLQQYVSDLQSNPDDNTLREKIIKLSQEMKPALAIPAEAEKFGNRAEYVITHAKSPADYADAVREYEKALLVAPWVSLYYYNLGSVSEKTGQLQSALRNYKLYLLAAPNAQDLQEVRKQIDGIEYVLEKAMSWATDPATGCKIGLNNSYWTLSAATWSGPVVAGKADGKGTLKVTIRGKDGQEVQGSGEVEMVAGLLDGKGTIEWSDGHSYNGDFKDGMRHGKGIMKYPDDHTYDGTWKNDEQLAGQIIVDKILGIPWGASEKEAKRIMLQRPDTKLYETKKEKDGIIVQTYMSPYNNESREIRVHFSEGKMYAVSVVFVVNGNQVLEQFNPLKQDLLKRYGPPSSVAGTGLDSFAKWTLGGINFVQIKIWDSNFPPQNPFRIIIQYVHSENS